MPPLFLFFLGALLVFASAEARAQSGSPDPQLPKSPCTRLHLPANANLSVILKDGRKLKGKLNVVRTDDFELISKGKTQTIACVNVVRAVPPPGFRHRLKHFITTPLVIAGAAVGLPGFLIAAAGARDVGLVIASPGLLLMAAADELDGRHCAFPLIYP